MKKLITHLRSQKEETRRHILHFLTLVFAVILFAFWVYSLGGSLSTESTKEAKKEVDLAPFSILKGNLVDGYNSISDPKIDVLE
ncbi:hypothetical protein HZA26_03795 [Candidatus Nomurabacteria bacterium]|nr:hypothetical protein [Candidatus Nomurabacteria bacterium]